jgi:hypothetical protein
MAGSSVFLIFKWTSPWDGNLRQNNQSAIELLIHLKSTSHWDGNFRQNNHSAIGFLIHELQILVGVTVPLVDSLSMSCTFWSELPFLWWIPYPWAANSDRNYHSSSGFLIHELQILIGTTIPYYSSSGFLIHELHILVGTPFLWWIPCPRAANSGRNYHSSGGNLVHELEIPGIPAPPIYSWFTSWSLGRVTNFITDTSTFHTNLSGSCGSPQLNKNNKSPGW